MSRTHLAMSRTHRRYPRVFPISTLVLILGLLVFFPGNSFAQQPGKSRNLLDSGKNQQSAMLQNALEAFALDRIGPAGDVISLMKAAPKTIRGAKVIWLEKMRTNAAIALDGDKYERYDALIDCWNNNNCTRARRIQAQIRAKYTNQAKPPPPPPPAGFSPGKTNTSLPPAPVCPDGQRWCYPGTYGSGGCYSIRAQNCTAGLICRRSYYACKLAGEAAHCQLGYTPCQSIKPRCTPPLKWCPPGPYGKGRCISQDERCIRGLVCQKNACICKLPNIPVYCAPCGAICQPRPKPAKPSPCPAGLKYCPPGAFGRGGCLKPYQSCIKGLVCPTGYFYCKLPGEPAYCALPGRRCVSKKKPVQAPVPPVPQTVRPSRCLPPRTWCPAGAYGPGRCYVRGAQRCIRGMICAAGFKACKRPGQRPRCIRASLPCQPPPLQTPPTPVFKPQSRCRAPQIWCPAGAYGSGGCYLPGVTRCIRGKTCPSGFKICKVAGERARCIPAMGMCLAQKRPTAPNKLLGGKCGVFNKSCPPGRYGGGGCYAPSRQQCLQGKICSNGTVLCKQPGKAVKCIRRGTTCGASRPSPGGAVHKPPATKPPSGPHGFFDSKFGSKTLGKVRTRPKPPSPGGNPCRKGGMYNIDCAFGSRRLR